MSSGVAECLFTQFIQRLNNLLTLKDLDSLYYFLGIQVHKVSYEFVLTQSQYIVDLLSKLGLLINIKPRVTPSTTETTLSISNGSPMIDPSFYRSVLGTLQYQTYTLPDISFTVNALGQFTHRPLEKH